MRDRFLLVLLLGFLTTASTNNAIGQVDGGEWRPVTRNLNEMALGPGEEPVWPGGCSGVAVDRSNGAVYVKVVGHGIWRSPDRGATWSRVDGGVISGRDETGWATSVDPNAPRRMVSFSLDGTAGWTVDGETWATFTDLGRNWDYGSVDWREGDPKTIIAVKHETTPPGEVYLSENGGMNWKQLEIHVLEDRGQPSMVGALGGGVLIYSRGEGIHRSVDGGETWKRVSEVNPLTRIPTFFGGAHYLGTSDGLLISRDAGATWEKRDMGFDIWQGPFFGRDQREMLVVGKSGIHLSSDAGASWRRVAGLKPKDEGFLFIPNWFGCYAWDPIHNIVYASSMGNQVFGLALD